MGGFDAASALEGLFDEEPDTNDDDLGGAVATRTDRILAGRSPNETIQSVLDLAGSLPSLDDVQAVADDDRSELTEREQKQKDQTEEVIRTALAVGDAAVWVIGKALDRAVKGRWWRTSYATVEEYVEAKIARSASYGRRLRAGADLALETADRTGTVPNPGQTREMARTEKVHGRQTAITMYEVVRDVSAEVGARPTAATLLAVHKGLPGQLPPEGARQVIERAARETLGVPIGTPVFDYESNNGGAADEHPQDPGSFEDAEGDAEGTAPSGSQQAGQQGDADEVVDAEIVEDSLDALREALRNLQALNKKLTKAAFAEAHEQEAGGPDYERLRQDIIKVTTRIRSKALTAPALAKEAAS